MKNRLRVLRAEREITQVDLALKVRMHPNAYWRIEKGYEIPTEIQKVRLARALKCDVADLGFQPTPSQQQAQAS